MAAPAPLPNYTALLNAFFLREYINQFVSPRLSADEQLEMRMKLEYELDRIAALQQSSAVYVLKVLQDALIASPLRDDMWSVVEWFLGFVMAKDEQWQREIDTDFLARYWVQLTDRQARESIIEGIVTIDFNKGASVPSRSRICDLFRSAGMNQSGGFTERGTELLQQLLREMFVAPAHADVLLLGHTISLSWFAGMVLRYCLAGEGEEVPRQAREAVLELAAAIDTGLRNQLELVFETAR